MTKTLDDMDHPSALVPELERELVAAARRGPRLVAVGTRARSTGVRAWWRSPLLAAAFLIVGFAAAALAAQQLFLTGAPVTVPPLQPHRGLGVPLPGSSAAITLRTSDPAGGPAWGARFIATTRGYGCLQLGRVVRGALGVIGQDGAFANDGRFHALPVDDLEGPFPCAPMDARGHAFAGVFVDGTPANGQLVEQSCSAPGRRISPPTRVCPARDERLVMAGMAGPLARTITYADPSGVQHTVSTVGAQGAYLVVLRAPAKLGPEVGGYEPGGPGLGTIREITYANGQVCNPGQERGHTARACPHVGEQPIAVPGVTAASVASPVSVALAKRRVRLRDRTVLLPMFVISFRARVPVSGGASAYLVSVSCGVDTQEGPVLSDVRAGQIVTKQIAQNNCWGTAHIRVSYAYGARNNSPLFYPTGTSLTVGTRTITVR